MTKSYQAFAEQGELTEIIVEDEKGRITLGNTLDGEESYQAYVLSNELSKKAEQDQYFDLLGKQIKLLVKDEEVVQINEAE